MNKARYSFLERLSSGNGAWAKTEGEQRAVRYLVSNGYAEGNDGNYRITDAGRSALASIQGTVLNNG